MEGEVTSTFITETFQGETLVWRLGGYPTCAAPQCGSLVRPDQS
jgi:hypothetical protein